MMWHTGDGMGWWMLLGSIWVFFFWVAIVWLFASVLSRGDGGGRQHEESALDIARRRYARGEISRDEFEQLRRDLS